MCSLNRTRTISGQYLHSLPRYKSFTLFGFCNNALLFLIQLFVLVKADKLETVGIFALSQLVLEFKAKYKFLILTVF